MTEQSLDTPLAPVHEGHLDRAGLKQLFFDIEHAARFLGARIKLAAERNSSDAECTLAKAFEALDTGSAMGVQLHYEHKQRLWCDTILRHAGGYRVVRVDQSRLGSLLTPPQSR